ncbi:MAG TPA: glycosyltransferase family 2 protein [Solirubrobacteraceae bacterium]|jgi:GT2 family glycosyltransferase
MAALRASVALLNYNGWELLNAALPSVVAQRFEGYEVVVVDNGSSDGSVRNLARDWPDVRVVALPENVGVTAALNRMVQATTGEYVALLNNDVELSPDWLAVLALALDRDPRVASVAGKLRRMDAPEIIDRAGDTLDWSSACHGRGAGARDEGQFDAPAEVFSVGGAAALYRRSVFEEIGEFDEQFFAYLEDVDWGFRARLAGYVNRCEPAAGGLHRGGATLGDVNAFSLYHLRRNQIWLAMKNYPGSRLLLHLPELVWLNTLHLAIATRRGRGRLVLHAYRDALAGLGEVLRKRRLIQARRRISPRALDAVVSRPAAPVRIRAARQLA